MKFPTVRIHTKLLAGVISTECLHFCIACILQVCVPFIIRKKKCLLFCKLLESIPFGIYYSTFIRLKDKFFSQSHNDHTLPFSNVFPTSIPSTYSSHPELLAVLFLYIIIIHIASSVLNTEMKNNLESVRRIGLPPTNSYGKSLN